MAMAAFNPIMADPAKPVGEPMRPIADPIARPIERGFGGDFGSMPPRAMPNYRQSFDMNREGSADFRESM
jgi:hypothetical protein